LATSSAPSLIVESPDAIRRSVAAID